MEFKGIMNKLPVMDVLQTKKECERRGITFQIENLSNMKLKIAYAEGYNVARSESGNPSYKEKRVNVLFRDEYANLYPITLTESQLRVLDFLRDKVEYDLSYDIVDDFEII